MREMKDSGIEWIGEIPKDWDILRLKYCFSGFANGTSDTQLNSGESFYPVTRIETISSGEINLDKIGYVAFCKKQYLLKTGDILVSNINSIKYLGNCAVVRDGYKLYHGMNLLRIVPSDYIDKGYAYYLFKSNVLKFPMEKYCKPAINQASVSATTMKNFFIPFPAFVKQQQIANFLDTKCSEINATAEDIQKEISLLEDYKKSVITEAVTKGLNPDAETKDSGIEWVGKVPATWKIMPNKYIMTKKKVIKEVYEGESIISLSMNGVIVRDLEAGGKMPKTFDGYQIVYPGNLLMCLFDYDVTPRCIGLIKDYGVTSPAYSQFVMNNGNYSGYYYYYYLMVDHTKALLHLAKNLRHSFTEEQLGAILAPVPTIEEQQQIADYLDTKCSEIDAIIADKKRQLDILADYKKSLIYEYVTGKKEVPVHE